ncbi:TIGR01458 family HAD hydrolase [Kwoniella newhampshirensis]|uniref:Haloacid dehalogenase-like hydrolase domain-containing protein 2 n=1 Tax=Kwoniella newhampshirensis TaxID=1651941 RepID=A0AAW0Z1K6_9TREE
MPNPLKLKALLIDLNGTLHIGHDSTPNAVTAIDRLRAARIPFIFCSNSTKESSASLLKKLRDMGFRAEQEDLMTSLGACRQLVEDRGLKRPLLLMSPSAKEEFASLPSSSDEKGYDSVILGLHEESLSYQGLNKAFRVLKGEPISPSSAATLPDHTTISTPALIAPHAAMYMQSPASSDLPAGLSLGIGPFVRALEEATSMKAEIVGKPTKGFFQLALKRLEADREGIRPDEVAVIGDDVNNDLGEGARELGLKRILVRTGKYRPDAEKSDHPPDKVCDTFSAFVDDLLK